MTFGSLFAGVGGFDLGFERAGLECRFQVENNAFCQRVLAKHWPDVRRYSDIRDFPPTEGCEPVDVICGGFPCKQTSVAASIHGQRTGLAGKDSGLWSEMLRVVRLVRPGVVVVENVSGAADYADEIEGSLAGAGYRIPGGARRLSAKAFGAPHRRRRLVWIAYRDEPGLAFARQEEPSTTDCLARGAADGNAWLPSLAGVLRVDDGIPGGLDRRERINAIGNAICPVVAEWIGRQLVLGASTLTNKG